MEAPSARTQNGAPGKEAGGVISDTTPDVIPVPGRVPQPEGFILAPCFSGHGFAMGPIVGRLLKEPILAG